MGTKAFINEFKYLLLMNAKTYVVVLGYVSFARIIKQD